MTKYHSKFGLGWLSVAHSAGRAELDPSQASPVLLPSDSLESDVPANTHPLPSIGLGRFSSYTKAGAA